MGAEKFAVWKQVTVLELKAYFGFMILMGMNNLQALIGLFHFISVHPLWLTKFCRSGLSRVPKRHLSEGTFLNNGMSPGVKSSCPGRCYEIIKCVQGVQRMAIPFHSACPGIHCAKTVMSRVIIKNRTCPAVKSKKNLGDEGQRLSSI